MPDLLASFRQQGLTLTPLKNERLYLLVDGSQINNLLEQLYSLDCEIHLEPIYLYEPWQHLNHVSPVLVQANSTVVNWFFSTASINNGYFLSSSQSLSEIADHFRNFIQVLTPYESLVFLKLAHAECAQIFYEKQLSNYWGKTSQVWLPTRNSWAFIQNSAKETKSTQSHQLTDQQWEKLGQISWLNTIESLAEHAKKYFPNVELNGLTRFDWTEHHASNAYEKGFTSQRDLMFYINVLGYLNGELPTEAKHFDIYHLIYSPSKQTHSQRIEQAAILASQYATSESEKQV